MARICEVCEKTTKIGNNIKHKQAGGWALRAPKTKKKMLPNLRNVDIFFGNETSSFKRSLKVCMKCYKKVKAL